MTCISRSAAFFRQVLPIVLCLLLPDATHAADTLTGPELREALEAPLSATWTGLTRREALQRVAGDRKLALLLDRRIDPSLEIVLEQGGGPLRSVLESLLPEGGGARVVGDTVYLGPKSGAGRLRTAIARRDQELSETNASNSRRLELGRMADIAYADLDTPAHILKRIADQWELTIDGLDQVPHDLWAGATLTNVTAGEALSLVLVQFDLTFAWTDAGAGVTLKPLPESVTIEQLHRVPPGLSGSALAADWKEAFPGLRTEADGLGVRVVGTLEQHEAIALLLKPGRKPAEKTPLKPLSRVRIQSLRFDNTVRKLMETLTRAPDTQLAFEFDEQQFQDAGIDLDQRIRFEVQMATVEDVLKQAFDPLNIQFKLVDRTVTLSPAK